MGSTPTMHLPWPDPTATIDIPEDIRKLAEAIDPQVSGAFPGMIVAFRGKVIPVGWALCDGTNGTLDLRNRFVLAASGGHPLASVGGVDSQTVAAVPHGHTAGGVSATGTGHQHGGAAPGVVAVAGVGAHSHNAGIASTGVARQLMSASGSLNIFYRTDLQGGGNAMVQGFSGTDGPAHGHTLGAQTADASGANPAHVHPASNTTANGGVAAPAAVDNRPVFYSLVYIMKLQPAPKGP